MGTIYYCTVTIQWRLTGQQWEKDANKFLFSFLKRTIISESYSKGLLEVQDIIDKGVGVGLLDYIITDIEKIISTSRIYEITPLRRKWLSLKYWLAMQKKDTYCKEYNRQYKKYKQK